MVYAGMCYKCIVISELKERNCWFRILKCSIHTLHNAYNLPLSNCICDMHAQHNEHVFVGGWTFLCIMRPLIHVLNTIPGAEDVTQVQKRYS